MADYCFVGFQYTTRFSILHLMPCIGIRRLFLIFCNFTCKHILGKRLFAFDCKFPYKFPYAKSSNISDAFYGKKTKDSET